MKFWKLISATTITTLAVGCGGGGGSSSTASSTTTSTTTYNFTPPMLNSQLTYARTTVDNANNTINQSYIDTVTAVNSDGSFAISRQDPTHNSIVVDGTIYSISIQSINIDSSGHETSYTEIPSGNSSPVTCTVTPHGAGPNYPISVGENWSTSWNVVCGSNAPINYMQTGSIVDTESITVPAGTFTTIKLQSTVSWTDANGTTHTDNRTTWKDINGSHLTIKEQDSYTISGTTPTHGYPVTVTTTLQTKS